MGSRTWNAAVAFLTLWFACVTVCGNPVQQPQPSNTNNILAAVLKLATECKDNPLLAYEPDLVVCKDPGDFKTLLECQSFLDVNRRLCALRNIAGFNLTEQVRIEKEKPVGVESLCNREKPLEIGSLREYPQYERNIKMALSVSSRCIKMCSSNNFMDDSPNYFCKILYYGSVIIQDVKASVERAMMTEKALNYNPVIPVNDLAIADPGTEVKSETQNSVTKTVKAEVESKINDEIKTKSEDSVKLPELQMKPVGADGAIVPPSETSQITDKKPDLILAAVQPDTSKDTKPTADQTLPETKDDKAPETNEVKPPTMNKITTNVEITNKVTPKVGETQVAAEIKPAEKASSPGIKEVEPIVSVDKPDTGVSAEQDDYDQVPGVGDASNLEGNNADDEDGPPINKVDTLLQQTVSHERQYGSNLGPPDDYMDDDDGHFFPMFFSAVVMMVLLYILYHNKNKIMGLLIEGRNPGGRRRNSRGHSYRRLDTLEQAISSNEPGVAPSKIIY